MPPPLPFPTSLFLAPMAGVTDAPYRKIVKTFGSGVFFSEMIASRPLLDDLKKNTSLQQRKYSAEFPLITQIAGRDSLIMAEAAQIIESLGAAMIDMNFGYNAKHSRPHP